MGYDYEALPETCDVAEPHLPWRDYDTQGDDEVLRRLEEKTEAITNRLGYDPIESATAVAAAVVNHERERPAEERREAVLTRAYELWRAGMTAN